MLELTQFPGFHLVISVVIQSLELRVMSVCIVFGRYRVFLLVVEPHHGTAELR
jgi:hypothetical protein